MRHGKSPRRRVRDRVVRARCSVREVARNARAREEPDRDAVGGQFAGKDAAAVGGETGAVRGLAQIEERAARVEIGVRVAVAVCVRGKNDPPSEFNSMRSRLEHITATHRSKCRSSRPTTSSRPCSPESCEEPSVPSTIRRTFVSRSNLARSVRRSLDKRQRVPRSPERVETTVKSRTWFVFCRLTAS